MFSRPLPGNIIDNPLLDSPFVQQSNIGISFNPIPADVMLYLSGEPMLYLDSTDMEYLGA